MRVGYARVRGLCTEVHPGRIRLRYALDGISAGY